VFAMPGPTIDSQIFAMPGPVLEESVVEESGDNEPVELPPAPAFFATSAPDKAPPVQVEVFEPQAEEFPMRIEEQPVIAEPQIQPQAQGAPMPQPALQAETPATPMTDEIGTPSLLMEPVDTPQSGLSQAPVEAKLVLSESARFMARLNQRLSEAEKKLDSKSDQAIMRLTDAVLDLSSLGESIEKEREKSSKDLAVTYWQHLESVVEQVKKRISEASESARLEFDAFFMEARTAVEDMNQELISTLRYADHRAQSDSEAHTTATRENIDQHIEEKVEEYNTRTEVVCELLDSTAQYYLKQLHERFQRFRSRMDEELNSISSSLDRNVRSMTEEIDGSWDRASEKLRSSHEEFEQTTNHLVRNCQLEIDREIKGACVEQILPKILENKAIFRAMLADMHRNFEEQSAKIIDEHLIGLEKNIESAKAELNRVVYKCLTDIEQVGKGHRDGLDELFNTTDKRLIEMTSEVESKLEGSRIEIVRNQEACNQLTEYATTEEDSSLSKERKKTKATLSEVRNTADNTLETAIGSSCLHLDQLGEQLGRDLTKTRLDWTNQVKTTGDEGTASIRKALQEAFQAIEIAREKYME
ncbi:MAG: hypothetical protein K8F91_24525, partial [Candidatus Obscuribacterales bacterium]|nr:hypothetical protein [Candidatus Obscuribacterales bacterium]